MSATATRTVRDGDTEPSCVHCHYFTGHTSWCQVGKLEAAAQRPARRHNLDTMPHERIAAEVIGRVVRVTTWKRGTEYGTVERVSNGRTYVRLFDGRTTWGPSGRVTVR